MNCLPKRKIKKINCAVIEATNEQTKSHTHTSLPLAPFFLLIREKLSVFMNIKYVLVMCSPCVNPFNILQNYFISSKIFRTSSYIESVTIVFGESHIRFFFSAEHFTMVGLLVLHHVVHKLW